VILAVSVTDEEDNLVGGAAVEDDAAAIAVCGTIAAYSELVNAGDKHHESVHPST
jgi:hypothetical protein